MELKLLPFKTNPLIPTSTSKERKFCCFSELHTLEFSSAKIKIGLELPLPEGPVD